MVQAFHGLAYRRRHMRCGYDIWTFRLLVICDYERNIRVKIQRNGRERHVKDDNDRHLPEDAHETPVIAGNSRLFPGKRADGIQNRK